jgi:hypothetical protein
MGHLSFSCLLPSSPAPSKNIQCGAAQVRDHQPSARGPSTFKYPSQLVICEQPG